MDANKKYIDIPMIALRGMTVLPGMIVHFDISRKKSVKALEKGAKDYQVTVEFDAYGQKILYAAFAKLKKL